MRPPRTRRRRPGNDPPLPSPLATGVRPFPVQREDEAGPGDPVGVLDSYLDRRSARGGTIQRYTVVDPSDLSAEKNTKVTTRDILQTRYRSAYSETESLVMDSGQNPRTNRKTSALNLNLTSKAKGSLPSFRVSEGGLLAVANAGQPRNLYAGQATVDESNRILAAAGSTVRLTRAGRGITVPQDPKEPESSETHQLDKVHAAKAIPPDALNAARIEIAQTFPDMECDSFIQLVLGASAGASRVAVLEKYGEDDETEVRADSGREPIIPIAWQMTRSKAPNAAKVKASIKHPPVLPQDKSRQAQIDYEDLSDTKRTARSQKLGLNEFALPEVGEGFVIRSMRTEALLDAQQQQAAQQNQPVVHTEETRQEMREGYLAALQELEEAEEILDQGRSGVSARVQDMMRSWGEHYAGVVAKDGEDVVTLENYNREQEVQWEHERIFNNLFRDFAAFRDLVANNVESLQRAPKAATIRQLVALAASGKKLEKDYREALRQAQSSFIHGLAQNDSTAHGNFFFQMYGPGEQSFHAAYKGIASNPMTLRIRESETLVRAEATQWLGQLDTLVTGLGTENTAHPVPGASANVLTRLQTARAAHTLMTQDLAQANTREALKKIERRAVLEWNAVSRSVLTELQAAYVRITGTQLAQQPTSFQDLRQTVDTYVNSYSWYQRAGTRYRSITALRALLVAIENY